MFPESIVKKVGNTNGKTIAVFAGIHGNEKAGVIALRHLIEKLEIVKGTVYFVFANPPAIEQNKRYIHKNLNRLFSRNITGDEYEVSRARELMDLLDTCDALLDLHSYNSESGEPFAIAEMNADDIVKKFNVGIVAEGFGDMGYGTDDYMYRNGKIGICLECGTSNRYKELIEFADKSVRQFLKYFECIHDDVEYVSVPQRRVRVKKLIYKQSPDFRFTHDFLDFEVLPTDKPFISDGEINLVAQPGEVIMFPRPDVKVGEEVCIIGKFVE